MRNNFYKKHELASVLIVSLALAFSFFGNGITGEFVFDDITAVQNRGDLKDVGNFFNLFTSPYHQNTPETGLYRPFTTASYLLNYLVFGSSPAGFHVINIVIHALNSVLVFWLLNHLFKSKKFALISFILFLLHPIHTEAVTSIVGRAELLALFWSLAAMTLFLKDKKLLAGAAFLPALMSKEIALAVLPMILYIDSVFLKTNRRKALSNVAFFALPLAAYSFLRYLALGQYFLNDTRTTLVENVLKFSPLPERIWTAFKVLYLYIEKLVWPVHLSADYSYNAVPVVQNILSSLQSTFGLLIFLALIAVVSVGKVRRTEFGFGAAVFLFPYLMISNLVMPVGTVMGERLMYFPSLGFSIISGFLIYKLSGRSGVYKTITLALLVSVLVFYGARTFVRNGDWRDGRTLFSATVKQSPDSLITRTALAGLHIRANEWDEARSQLEKARSIYEDNSRLQNLLGIVADHDGDFLSAEARYKRSLELNQDALNSNINLAELYLKQGRLLEARDSFKKVIDFYPAAEYVVRYGYIQAALNDPDGAIATVNKYLGKNLNHPNVSALLGTAYFLKHDYARALVFLKKAQELGNKAPEIDQLIQIINKQK